MAEVSSRRQVGRRRRWDQRVWLRGLLPAALLLMLWIFSMGSWMLWFGNSPTQPRASLGKGCVLVNWQTPATWHVVGTATLSLGTNLRINGVSVEWYTQRPIWNISDVADTNLRLVIEAGVVQIPLFYPVLVAAVVPVFLRYLRTFRLQPWQCVKCRYDLRNFAGLSRCPECGSPFVTTVAHTPEA